jgi:DOPA 4,5-dioxygenase
MMNDLDPRSITGYHAHIYYDEATRSDASWVRDEIRRRYSVVTGRWREKPVGPHPISMYQVAFETDIFDQIVPWLMLNHRGLSVLIHPESNDAVADHEDFPIWLGPKLDLNIEFLRQFAQK